ncbi:MAG: hypothetical protein AABM64_08110 [Pseudomonadota bacterium]
MAIILFEPKNLPLKFGEVALAEFRFGFEQPEQSVMGVVVHG